jgi:anti-sigma factor RsiW
VSCAESLRLQAYFDGELDAPGALEIEAHLEQCPACRALLQDLEQLRVAIRRELAPTVPAALRARIARRLDQESAAGALPPRARRSWSSRPFWLGALGGAGGSALAATLMFLLLSPSMSRVLLDELVAAHVRSLMPAHLIDVESTDQHTVKPWFAGHADVSPVVADFAAQGYRLVGGRADYLDQQRAAVVVYQHGAHVINVFSWSERGGLSEQATRNGYHMLFWKSADVQYCAVSDAGWDELSRLVRLLQQQGTHDNPH